jgi:MHS family proline/betaine transporter-like MFS transporter
LTKAKTIAAGIIGNTIEYYDFALIGFLASAIGANFFPSSDPALSVLWAFGAFAAGMVMRPVGGAIFGHIGDKSSRKTALLLSLALMTLPTFAIGLLPTYAQIGIAAPILLVLMRLIQGVSVGGEYASSIVYLVEQAPNGKKNFFGAFVSAGAKAGMTLGSAVCGAMLWWLDAHTINEWGWRVPFLLSLPLLLFGVWLRRTLEDDFKPKEESVLPILELAREHKALFGLLMAVASAIWVQYYFVFIYLPTWLQGAAHISAKEASAISTVVIFSVLAGVFAAALIADKKGGWFVLKAAVIISALLSYPALWLMLNGFVWTGALLSGAILAILQAPIYATVPLSLPRHLRASGSALVFGVAAGVIGGLTPLVLGWLVRASGSYISPAFVMITISILALVSLRLYKGKSLVLYDK